MSDPSKRGRYYVACSCAGKFPFKNASDAQKSIRPDFKKWLKPYRCKVCGMFHVGKTSAGTPRAKNVKIKGKL